MSEIHDKHTLYVSYNTDVNNEQIACCFYYAIKQLEIPCDFRVNLVTNQIGKKFGYAYVWVSEPRVYNALIGLDFDGTKVKTKIRDPDWNMPEKPYEIALRELKDSFKENRSLSNKSWGEDEPEETDWGSDPIEETEDQLVDNLKNRYQPQMIEVDGEPHVTLPKYELSDQQLEKIYQGMKESREIEESITLEQALNKHLVTKLQQLEVSGAYTPQESDENAYLFVIVPNWVTHQILKAIVGTYVSYNRNNKYPFLREKTIKSGKKTFSIYFQRGTFDVFFAHLMLRKVPIKNKKTNKLDTLYFILSFKKTRKVV